jgi:enoyl-CoA hydratase/carnithine racemase
LSGDYGIAWLLTRLVGTSRARELMFTADKVDAARCEAIGLVNRVVPDASLQNEAFALARSIAEGPTIALRYIGSPRGRAGLHRETQGGVHWEIERTDIHTQERRIPLTVEMLAGTLGGLNIAPQMMRD